MQRHLVLPSCKYINWLLIHIYSKLGFSSYKRQGAWWNKYLFLQLRVYTPDNIVNEMEKAKVDYLEASVGVTSKKKILVPKLLQWYMSDFADDMESLLEWIYSQLPRSGSLKRLIMECLNGEAKSPINKMVEVQPYESEFRYLLPS